MNISSEDTFGFFAYLSLTVSLSELGVGAREGAVHLLEREIQLERRDLQNLRSKPPLKQLQCDGDRQGTDCNSRLVFLQKLIILLRLELNQTIILKNISSSALDIIRIRRLLEMIDDYETALIYFDPDGRRRNSLKKRSINDPSIAQCAPDLQSIGEPADRLFANFSLAEVSAKNSVLDYVGKNPSILIIHPEYIKSFDAFAQDLSVFDIKCLAVLRADLNGANPDLIWASNFDSVGAYWGAKGDNFGTRNSDSFNSDNGAQGGNLDTKSKIKALCNSKTAYVSALILANSGKRTGNNAIVSAGDYDTLDAQLTQDENNTLPITIRNGLDRTQHSLDQFSAADVADACK